MRFKSLENKLEEKEREIEELRNNNDILNSNLLEILKEIKETNRIKIENQRKKECIEENEVLIGQIINSLKDNYPLLKNDYQLKIEDKEKLKETISELDLLIGAKKVFISSRWEIIFKLNNCYDIRTNSKMHDNIDRIINLIKPLGKLGGAKALGIPDALIGLFDEIHKVFKEKFADEKSRKFVDLISNDSLNSSKIFNKIEKNYQSLNEKGNMRCNNRLFKTNYEILCSAVENCLNPNIWIIRNNKKEFSKPEIMEKTMLWLASNLKELINELEKEIKLNSKFSEEINCLTEQRENNN